MKLYLGIIIASNLGEKMKKIIMEKYFYKHYSSEKNIYITT